MSCFPDLVSIEPNEEISQSDREKSSDVISMLLYRPVETSPQPQDYSCMPGRFVPLTYVYIWSLINLSVLLEA